MAYGKRESVADPLTEHDVAERLGKAAERLLKILMDARQIEGADEDGKTFSDHVLASRYLPVGLLGALAYEIEKQWGVAPHELPWTVMYGGKK